LNGITRLRAAATRAVARGDTKPISDGDAAGALNKKIARFTDLVSDWSLTFPLPRHRAGNRRRQDVFPLPDSVRDRALPKREARALRLYYLTFSEEEIARHTALPLERVRLVITHYASTPVARIAKLTDLPEGVIKNGRAVRSCAGPSRGRGGLGRAAVVSVGGYLGQ
jgi:hypothetical protein